MTETSFEAPHFPSTPTEALADLREIAAAIADDLRVQSARQRVQLEEWLENHFRPGLRLLPMVDVSADWVVSLLRRVVHLAGRWTGSSARRSREWARLVDAKVAARVDDHGQHHLAHALLAATASLALLAGLASLPAHGGQTPLRVDRLADGTVARHEALADPAATKSAPAGPSTPIAVALPRDPVALATPAGPTRGALPTGKGMWLYLPERVEGGDPAAIVARAKASGLTHLYVRTGSSKAGFYAQDFLNRLLPVAHGAGLRIYGWDFPYLDDPGADVNRAMAAITHTTPTGDRIDGFSADIELRSMGVNISAETATYYGENLRRLVGPRYPLIATVPRPSPQLSSYPFAAVVQHFDAIAPMVYWMNRDPAADVGGAIDTLAQFGKPVIPVGQAYDGSAEGGPPGVPSGAQIRLFMQVAEEHGAPAISFWSWQHADQQAWDAISQAPQFTLPAAPQVMSIFQVRAYQHLLLSMGYTPGATGQMDQPTVEAVRAFQSARGLDPTGVIDERTRDALMTPYPSPIGT